MKYRCEECEDTGRVGDLGPGGIYRNGKQVNNETAACDECRPNSLDVANAMRRARGETPCAACDGRGWNEVDTGDGRSDGNLYTEPCEICDGTGVEG